MPSPRNVVIREKRRVFDGFFKIDELTLSHEQFDGTMSPGKKLLVFERGDAAAAIILNRDRREVVLVEQFKVPTLEKSTTNGWVTEVMAGMIRPGETPDEAVIRETLEETGYRIQGPELIATFFSSPGGSSERIFLYYAVVGDADKVGRGGGARGEGEDIRLVTMKPEELFEKLRTAALDDPKLIVAAYHLRDRLKIEAPARAQLGPGTILYGRAPDNKLKLGIKTGEIMSVQDVDVWVNSENTDMMMDRVIGRTISANIRYGGAQKDADGNIVEDTIAEALRQARERTGTAPIGAVVETTAGALGEFGVKRILHVASVRGQGPGKGVSADPATLGQCVTNVLEHASGSNARWWHWGMRDASILLPMMGAGDGGLPVEVVAPAIVGAADAFFEANPDTALREVYLLAFTTRDRAACEKAIQEREHYRLLRPTG
jgi:nudix-type nucleoside diphosphatase (YffH/AdpP family)